MSNFRFCCTVLFSLSCLGVLEAAAVFECSNSHACRGAVITCQCQDNQAVFLTWFVRRPEDGAPALFITNPPYGSTSEVGMPTTMGDYSVVLNSTDPLSSQLSITLTQPVLSVECHSNVRSSTTLQRIDGKQSMVNDFKVMSICFSKPPP